MTLAERRWRRHPVEAQEQGTASDPPRRVSRGGTATLAPGQPDVLCFVDPPEPAEPNEHPGACAEFICGVPAEHVTYDLEVHRHGEG